MRVRGHSDDQVTGVVGRLPRHCLNSRRTSSWRRHWHCDWLCNLTAWALHHLVEMPTQAWRKSIGRRLAQQASRNRTATPEGRIVFESRYS
jgi:Uri superfamily endonuclease